MTGGTSGLSRSLGPWAGYLAGWSFVIGKTASIAAMGMALAAYVAPEEWYRPAAIATVWMLVGLNLLGVDRTAQAAKVLAVLAIAGILTGLGAGWLGADIAVVVLGVVWRLLRSRRLR